MGDGYYIFEPEQLDQLAKHPQLHGLLIEIEKLLIARLYNNINFSNSNVSLNIISVEYYGKYPAIGVKNANDIDITMINNYANQILSDQGIELFLKFLVSKLLVPPAGESGY